MLSHRALAAALAVATMVAGPRVLARPGAHSPEPAARGAIVHVVQPGQYLSLIAKRYHTTAEAIRKENGLSPATTLRPGMTLRIGLTAEHRAWQEREEAIKAPRHGRIAPASPPPRPLPGRVETSHPAKGKSESPRSAPGDAYARRPLRPGFIDMSRGSESFRGPLRASNGKLLPKSTARIDWLMRSLKTEEQLRIDRRLIKLLSQVSDHFGGRPIQVVSGFRPYSPKQFTRHSRHNHGQAIDFHIAGVPNLVLFQHCLFYAQVGCGYYPNSVFVHMDVRALKTRWVDYSRPGERPNYARPKVAAPKPGPKPALDNPQPPDDDDDDPEPDDG